MDINMDIATRVLGTVCVLLLYFDKKTWLVSKIFYTLMIIALWLTLPD